MTAVNEPASMTVFDRNMRLRRSIDQIDDPAATTGLSVGDTIAVWTGPDITGPPDFTGRYTGIIVREGGGVSLSVAVERTGPDGTHETARVMPTELITSIELVDQARTAAA